MLVECCRFILLECPSCERLNSYELNYFNFISEGSLDFKCECGDLNGSVTRLDRRSLLMDIHCLVCDKVHIYSLSMDRIFGHNSSLSCLDGERICLIGDGELLARNLEKKAGGGQSLGDGLALLMKKLYTLDEEDKIGCSCGNGRLVARLSTESLYLSCGQCGEEAILRIDSSEALRLLLEKDKIVIGKEKVSLS